MHYFKEHKPSEFLDPGMGISRIHFILFLLWTHFLFTVYCLLFTVYCFAGHSGSILNELVNQRIGKGQFALRASFHPNLGHIPKISHMAYVYNFHVLGVVKQMGVSKHMKFIIDVCREFWGYAPNSGEMMHTMQTDPSPILARFAKHKSSKSIPSPYTILVA